MLRLASSFFISNAIYVAAKLGIADLLAQGPRTATQLAHATNTHAGALRRVLRFLVNYGILNEQDTPASTTDPQKIPPTPSSPSRLWRDSPR